jgi:transcriptional regulator with AAA-type ATPase domain
LSEAGQLPDNTRFIKTYDDKSDKAEKRFKQFSIQEIPTNLISTIGADFKVYSETKSPSRELVNKKMAIFLKSGFSILLIGERGIGKSQIAGKAKERLKDLDITYKGEIIEANCASFDDDSKAEAELFGYEKGAFTGAITTKKGLLEEANGGILFLDEIHHLSKLVQAKLMKSLQTDKDNKMKIRRMGNAKETELKCRLIFATNKSVPELRNELLPDFYDRIVQHVVNIPPLRDTVEDRITDWENIWKGLKFIGEAPKELELEKWIKKLPLYGNFRDLQKIAMYYNAFTQFDDATKKMLNEANAFQYAKNEFEKYHSPVVQLETERFNFNLEQTTKQMIADYWFELQNWAVSKFGSRNKAIEHFKSLGDSVTEKTFNDWKNKKSLKSKE